MTTLYKTPDFDSAHIDHRPKDPQLSTPPSQVCELVIDVENLDAKLCKHQQNPPTPIISPAHSEQADSEQLVDINRRTLLRWGLNHDEIDQARKWDQKPNHHSAESIHMRLLSECVQEISHFPPSLSLLHNEYENKMITYNRRKHTVDGYSTARYRAQNAAHEVVLEMQIRGYSAEDMVPYYEVTRDDRATMELIAEHCENKLKELKRKGRRQPARKGQKAGTMPPRHSMRLRKRAARKGATEG